jgi:hypothetical protein
MNSSNVFNMMESDHCNIHCGKRLSFNLYTVKVHHEVIQNIKKETFNEHS